MTIDSRLFACLLPIVMLASAGCSASERVATIKLAPRQDIAIEATSAGGAKARYTIHYIPPDFPAYQVTTAAAQLRGDETILITPKNSMLLMIDREGNPLYYRIDTALQLANFQNHTVEGLGKVYSYLAIDPTYKSLPTLLGTARLMDAQFRDVGEMPILPHGDHGTLPNDLHEVLVLGDQHYVSISYFERTLDLSGHGKGWSDEARIVDNIVQEVDHGVVTFEWATSDRASLFDDSVDGNTFTSTQLSDYAHLNSIEIDPADGNFIFSMRHTNSIIKVDRSDGATVWTLGGASDEFSLGTEQRFSHQHHAKLQKDGSLLVFDNGNNAHQTRVLSFSLDQPARQVRSFKVVYEKPSEFPQTTFMGSAFQLAPTRYLMGWGGWAATPTSPPSVTEIVDGAVVWTLKFDFSTVFSYRAVPISL